MKRRAFLEGLVAAAGAVAFPNEGQAADRGKTKTPIIDVHCHAGRGLNFGKDDSPPWTTYNDPQWVLKQAELAGIDKSVIFPINNETYREANEEIAQYVQRHPDRLIGFAKHDPQKEAGRIREMLVREVRELGLKGLKLHAVPTAEVLEAVTELRIPILMHPPRVEDSLEVVRKHPEINFIMAHLGSFASRDWKQHLKAIEAAKQFPNLHLDTSGVVMFPYLEKAARELPAEKLLFGSDAPLVDARVEIHKIRLLNLSAEAEEKILGGNALRLLRVN